MRGEAPERRGAAGTVAASQARPARLLWWAIGLLSAFTLMGVLVALSPTPFTQGIDDWWRRLVGVGPDSAAYTWLLPMFFQMLGEAPGFLVTAVVIPVVLLALGRWRSAVFFFTTTIACQVVIAQVAKNLVDRPRPAEDLGAGLFGPLFSVNHGSYPSGHALAVGALVVAIAAVLVPVVRRWWWIVGVALSAGIVWQRTLINAHWLSDTIFGLIAGAGGALLMWWAFWPLLHKDLGRRIWFLHRHTSGGAAEDLTNSREAIQ